MENKLAILLCTLLGLINIPFSVQFMLVIKEGLYQQNQINTPMFDASAILPLSSLGFVGWNMLLIAIFVLMVVVYSIIRFIRKRFWTDLTLKTILLMMSIPVISYLISVGLVFFFSDMIKGLV